jgi:hypothetical protein
LRDTRLDELPQLLNILKGDMDFVGPRPVRPEVYEAICRYIPNYDRRFAVKPGLVGFSQLFTPHNTPKRIRTLIDNTLLRRKQRLFWDSGVILYTGVVILRATVVRLLRNLYHEVIRRLVLRRYTEKRELPRVRPTGARVVWAGPGGSGRTPGEAELVDLNEQAFLMRTRQPLPRPRPATVRLEIDMVNRHGARRTKRAECSVELYREAEGGGKGAEYVFTYTPASPFNYYIVHQYFLRESLA